MIGIFGVISASRRIVPASTARTLYTGEIMPFTAADAASRTSTRWSASSATRMSGCVHGFLW